MTTFSYDATHDLGHGVTAKLQRCDGEPDGVEYTHACNGVARAYCIPVKPAWSNGWDILSVDPLTLHPSLACTSCGHHGFIRNGKWVPA